LRGESALLQSQIPLSSNELLRLGGWNSLRGFNESSLLSNFYYFGTAEYRYLIGNQAFFDIFGQYGQIDNKNLNTKTQVYSLGLGFNFFLPIGLMSFQISNGNPVGNPIQFNDTKIHWGILAKF
jgi:hemolysin activation/secretion protein